MSKICTSIEQSKHLLELGLDTWTADMSYYETVNGNYYPQLGRKEENDIPAWSLSALVELSSNYRNKTDILRRVYHRTKGVYYVPRNSDIPPSDFYANAIDAIYEIVVWLLENKKL